MNNLHLFSPKHVALRITKIEKHGSGKHRAWCHGTLCDNTDFWEVVLAIHPEHPSAGYYEPHCIAICSECLERGDYQNRMMSTEDYSRLLCDAIQVTK